MFLLIDVFPREEEIGFNQVRICSRCGKAGAVRVFMICTCLRLFFIPVFRWNYRYIARMECCGDTVELDQETGEAIRRGEITSLDERFFPDHSAYRVPAKKVCMGCGFTTEEDWDFCPRCGRRF